MASCAAGERESALHRVGRYYRMRRDAKVGTSNPGARPRGETVRVRLLSLVKVLRLYSTLWSVVYTCYKDLKF